MKVFLQQLSHRWQPGVSTALSEPPHCEGLSLCKSKVQAAKALAAAGGAAPCFPRAASWETLEAWEEAWSPQGNGPEGWRSGGAKCSSFGRGWKSSWELLCGRFRQCSPSVFLGALFSGNISILSS